MSVLAPVDRYSTVGRRVFAGFVDGLVLSPIGFADAWLMAPDRAPAVILAWTVVSANVYWLYAVILHSRTGQTIGKKVAGITVMDLSEARLPTFRQAFLREAVYVLINWASAVYLFTLVLSGRYTGNADASGWAGELMTSAIGVWFLLEIVTTLTNDKRRAVHDFIASTVVLRDDTENPGLPRPELPLTCPRCGAIHPSRLHFADPKSPDSICENCAFTERVAPRS